MLMMAVMVAAFSWNIIEQKQWNWLPVKEVTKDQNQKTQKAQNHLSMVVSQRFQGGQSTLSSQDSPGIHPISLYSLPGLIPGFRGNACDWIQRERTRPKVETQDTIHSDLCFSWGSEVAWDPPPIQPANTHTKWALSSQAGGLPVGRGATGICFQYPTGT